MIEFGAKAKNDWSPTNRFLSAGEMMPDFALVSMNGRRVRISDYRGRSNLVLVFCARGNSKETRSFLRQVFEQRWEFEGEEAQVLVIVRQSKDLSDILKDLPFPVLRDKEGHAHDLAGVAANERNFRPVIYVVDRYGEIRHVCRAGDASHTGAGAILDWVRYINLECPE